MQLSKDEQNKKELEGYFNAFDPTEIESISIDGKYLVINGKRYHYGDEKNINQDILKYLIEIQMRMMTLDEKIEKLRHEFPYIINILKKNDNIIYVSYNNDIVSVKIDLNEGNNKNSNIMETAKNIIREFKEYEKNKRNEDKSNLPILGEEKKEDGLDDIFIAVVYQNLIPRIFMFSKEIIFTEEDLRNSGYEGASVEEKSTIKDRDITNTLKKIGESNGCNVLRNRNFEKKEVKFDIRQYKYITKLFTRRYGEFNSEFTDDNYDEIQRYLRGSEGYIQGDYGKNWYYFFNHNKELQKYFHWFDLYELNQSIIDYIQLELNDKEYRKFDKEVKEVEKLVRTEEYYKEYINFVNNNLSDDVNIINALKKAINQK